MSEPSDRKMARLRSTVYLLFLCLKCLTEADMAHSPRMVFTDTVKSFPLPEHHAPVQIILEKEPHNVTSVGHKHLISFNLQNPQQTPLERKVLWKDCSGEDCGYNISVVHKREEANQVFVCGTNSRETLCCDMNLSDPSPMCIPSEKLGKIEKSIKEFIIKEGEQSALVESAGSADLYITYSGSQSNNFVGIHKFGANKVGPAHSHKEQHYVGLVVSRREDNPLQDKVYAFYKEKNKEDGLYSEMWLPFVTQICMADAGGPKNNLQFSWTSQLNARLFCGDVTSKQHFSELVDVATVHAQKWQNTMVYALFRNEWGMSAVCVYTIQDIDNIFRTSPFIGSNQENRSRECVPDSTKIPSDTLRKIKSNLEMKEWIRPVDKSGPLLFNHHSYSRIYVPTSQNKSYDQAPVLFLSLNNGEVHKVIQNKNSTFIIAEYRPFNHTNHILSIILHPSSMNLFVNSGSELVQLDVANCAQYGDSCEECVLARDPYCGWNGIRCTRATTNTLQDVAQGNHFMCLSVSRQQPVRRPPPSTHADKAKGSIALRSQSKYFLECPVSSHHAKYTWRHFESSTNHESNTSCNLREERCLHLIDSMGPEQVGTYNCESEEMGYSRVLAQYQIQLENRAGVHSSCPLVWVCLMAVLIKSCLVSLE